jgi:hypothetical protein
VVSRVSKTVFSPYLLTVYTEILRVSLLVVYMGTRGSLLEFARIGGAVTNGVKMSKKR